jgi:hypothetical protein
VSEPEGFSRNGNGVVGHVHGTVFGRERKEYFLIEDSPLFAGEGADEGNMSLKTISRTLRKKMTPAERVMCRALRLKQVDEFKFRRQFPVGKYVVDFVCLENK